MRARLRARIARALLRLGRERVWRRLLGTLQIVFGAGTRRPLDLARLQGLEPQFVSRDLYLRIPKGWCYIDAELRAGDCAGAALFVDVGRGFGSEPVAELHADELGSGRGLVRIPATTVAIRLDPLAASGEIELGPVVLSQTSAFAQLVRTGRAAARRLLPAAGRAGAFAATSRAAIARPARVGWRSGAGFALSIVQRRGPRTLTLEPERQLASIASAEGRWHALGREARFRLTGEEIPHGWCRVTTTLEADGAAGRPRLVAVRRQHEEQLPLDALEWGDGGALSGHSYIPPGTQELLWAPTESSGPFRQGNALVLDPAGPVGRRRMRRSH